MRLLLLTSVVLWLAVTALGCGGTSAPAFDDWMLDGPREVYNPGGGSGTVPAPPAPPSVP